MSSWVCTILVSPEPIKLKEEKVFRYTNKLYTSIKHVSNINLGIVEHVECKKKTIIESQKNIFRKKFHQQHIQILCEGMGWNGTQTCPLSMRTFRESMCVGVCVCVHVSRDGGDTYQCYFVIYNRYFLGGTGRNVGRELNSCYLGIDIEHKTL